MSTIVRRNERSWAIEIITKINEIVSSHDYMIKKAGGESTISTGRGNTMFPDVILYGNNEQNIILQGWELKMPDVPIENETFIKDAQRKANALSLNSCVIWNFTYAVLYVREDSNKFKKVKQWSDTNYIHTRNDVQTYRKDWETLLNVIIQEINNFLCEGNFRQTTLGDAISSTTLSTIINRNQAVVAENIRKESIRNTRISAYISEWWNNIKIEYEHDETNPYFAYAKSVILNWVNRITFAHIIKLHQNAARAVDKLDFSTKIDDANAIFEEITKKSDFYNIFSSMKYNTFLPELTWQDMMEYSIFLKNNGIESLDQKILQNILERSVNLVKRELNGQYTTPPELAKILVNITVINWEDDFLDCCCGTGTIPKAAIDKKKEILGTKKAIETVWASDKYSYPLQVANISMTAPDTINLANRIFKKNALTLNPLDKITIVDPVDGKAKELQLPLMGAVASNLPFVAFENLSNDDIDAINKISKDSQLNGRSDLYCYIALNISKILKTGGRLGIITSNSWLGTESGSKFVESLKKEYYFEQVHISGKGKWFQNADVVTTIIILRKKDDKPNNSVSFFLWMKTLEELQHDNETENKLINSSLLNTQLDDKIVKLSSYSLQQINTLHTHNISYNALFHNITWFEKFYDVAVPINNVFEVFRGSRRGWDAMFYPKAGEHHIEKQYLKKVLKNAKNIKNFYALPDGDAFCCNVSENDLKSMGHLGALEWIEKFKEQKNKKGKPLPEVLAKKGMQWYEMKDLEVAEIFTTMNPDQRLFFSKFDNGASFINQRLIGLVRKDNTVDIELSHALLNSVFTMFSIEASGFGRGLGVLDINSKNLAKCMMLSPNYINSTTRNNIVKSFSEIKKRKVMRVSEEIKSPDRIKFEKAVFSAYGLEMYLDKVIESLISMQNSRATVKEK